jgi:hypothetical protein
MRLALILLLAIGCSSARRGKIPKKRTVLKNNTKIFNYNDMNGEYFLNRDYRVKANKFVVRNRILSPEDQSSALEKTTTVSQIGYVKGSGRRSKAIRPEIAQHEVWLDKKRYFSQLKIIPNKRSVQVTMDSPEKKWQGTKYFTFPKNTKMFCFFNQIPECIQHLGLLSYMQKTNKKVPITVIWESYPYHTQQYKQLIDRPYQVATLSYDGHSKKLGHKIAVDLGNQLVFYHFNNDNQFERMFWISQGVSMVSAELGE